MPVQAAEPGDLSTQLQTASALHKRADYAHSIPLLRQIVQKSPRNYLGNLLLGVDLLRSGSVKEAMAPLRTASAVRPDDGAPQAYLAQAATALGDFALVSEALQSAVARSGGDAQYLMAWGDYCLDRFRVLELSLRTTKRGEAMEFRVEAWGHPEGSETRETLLEQSSAADPEQRGIWGELGVAQLALGKRTQAQETLKEAEQRDPQGANTLQFEALLAAEEHTWQEAEQRLLAVGVRSPSELREVLGGWPAELTPGREVSGAVWDCLRNRSATCTVLSAGPQGGEGLSAKDLYAEGRWDQLKSLPPAPAVDASESLWRGVALAKTDDCPKAIPSLERGLKADELVAGFWLEACFAIETARAEARLSAEGNESARHELAGDRHLRLRYDAAAAQAEYAEALKSRPRDSELLAKLAEAYKKSDDSEHARETALAALALNPHLTSAIHTLAEMAISQRDYAEALLRLKQLAFILPKDAWTQVELGVTYGQLGNPSEALRYLGPQLVAGFPDKKGALHAQLANALRKLGRTEEAKQAAAEAARLANQTLQSNEQGNTDANK
jgi:tetratricopeptide (TPR) repeat protein